MEAKRSERRARKATRFAELHERGTFVIPNPWDVGSAKVLAGLGFEALATTSSGLAFTLGRADGAVTLDEVTAHVEAVDRATPLPVSTDLEDGYGPRPEDAARAITAAAEAGAVGGSIEDFSGARGIHDHSEAVERVVAAVEAARKLPFPFTFTARAENFIRGNPDLEDTIRRLRAFEQAGADVLYAPGLRNAEQVAEVCAAVSAPVNVLAHRGLTLAELATAGARRVSVGGSLAWSALRGLTEAAELIRDQGSFGGLARPPAELDHWLAGPERADDSN
jgi:2-methylisocitrate lyase-like PEP mutase family enzyme